MIKNAISKLVKNAIDKENKGEVGMFYVNNKRSSALTQDLAGVQFPQIVLQAGTIHTLTEKSSPVKLQNNDIKNAQQFKRTFKETQIVDNNWNPLVVYSLVTETAENIKYSP